MLKVVTIIPIIIIITEVEAVEVEAEVVDVAKTGLGTIQIIIITITITIKDHLMHSRRHQAPSSRISPSGHKTAIKVKRIFILWILLLK